MPVFLQWRIYFPLGTRSAVFSQSIKGKLNMITVSEQTQSITSHLQFRADCCLCIQASRSLWFAWSMARSRSVYWDLVMSLAILDAYSIKHLLMDVLFLHVVSPHPPKKNLWVWIPCIQALDFYRKMVTSLNANIDNFQLVTVCLAKLQLHWKKET